MLIVLVASLITSLCVIALGSVVKCSNDEVVKGPAIRGVFLVLNRSKDMADYGLFNVFKDRAVGMSFIERRVIIIPVHAVPKGAQLGSISTVSEADLLYIQTHRAVSNSLRTLL